MSPTSCATWIKICLNVPFTLHRTMGEIENSINDELHPILERLVKMPFFKYFKASSVHDAMLMCKYKV